MFFFIVFDIILFGVNVIHASFHAVHKNVFLRIFSVNVTKSADFSRLAKFGVFFGFSIKNFIFCPLMFALEN